MNTVEEVDVSRLRAFDIETHKILPGLLAPPLVVGSMAGVIDGAVEGQLLYPRQKVLDTIGTFLREKQIIVLANGAFDMVDVAVHRPALLPLIFQAYRERRVLDVLIIHTLDAIYGGHLGIDPRTGAPLRNPATNEVTTRYALATVLDLIFGRTDAKDAAAWRTSYALLEKYDPEFWPDDAREYPVHDTKNTLQAVIAQLHGWVRGHTEIGEDGPARNFNNVGAQCETAFCLQLGAAHSLRTDSVAVEELAAKVEKQHEVAVRRFQKFGWIRTGRHAWRFDGSVWRCARCSKMSPIMLEKDRCEVDPDEGTEDQVEVKRSVAKAYGVEGVCARCSGDGRVVPIKTVECRGEKIRGRYQGCATKRVLDKLLVPPPPPCSACSGTGWLQKPGDSIVCMGRDGGCDGTGLDLASAPLLPRTDKGGIRADRDTLMESGDDELAVYGEDEFEKVRSTFVPYLRSGTTRPLKLVPNVLVASGRISYEGSPFHQLTRAGGVRETIVARDGRVLGATDYEAGELCALGQYAYWTIGYSGIRDAINASGKPGILHSEGAAAVIGISIEEFLVRLKNKDKQCVDFRQAFKPINFGTPGGMGSAKLVWTSRKRNAGFTPSEHGPSLDENGRHGYAGIRFCILIGGADRCGSQGKITEWKKRPTYPVCKACVEIVEHVLRAAYFKRFPEVREYFKWVSKLIDGAGRVPCLAWNAEKGEVEILRWRGGVDFPAGCNNGFQALLADIMKLAYVTMTREGYLGVKDDGSPSPLVGCRFPVVMHDEPISELFEHSAHLSGPRVGEIMEEAGQALAPDVTWVAKTAIAKRLSKSMEPVYNEKGDLVLWTPKKAA